jgi:hypothetical protein
MKIEVDLNDIFSEETAECSIEEAIRMAIIDRLTARASKRIDQKMSEEINRLVPLKVNEVLNSIIPTILDYEFTETSSYGEKKETMTVRDRICKDMATAMKWKDGSYDSDRSAYTKVVRNVIEKRLTEFAKEFHKDIDSKFLSACIGYAQAELQKKLGIAK